MKLCTYWTIFSAGSWLVGGGGPMRGRIALGVALALLLTRYVVSPLHVYTIVLPWLEVQL